MFIYPINSFTSFKSKTTEKRPIYQNQAIRQTPKDSISFGSKLISTEARLNNLYERLQSFSLGTFLPENISTEIEALIKWAQLKGKTYTQTRNQLNHKHEMVIKNSENNSGHVTQIDIKHQEGLKQIQRIIFEQNNTGTVTLSKEHTKLYPCSETGGMIEAEGHKTEENMYLSTGTQGYYLSERNSGKKTVLLEIPKTE